MITLRQFYAGLVLAGIMACPNDIDLGGGGIIEDAFEVADNMIAYEEKERQHEQANERPASDAHTQSA